VAQLGAQCAFQMGLNVTDRHPTGLPPKCLHRPPDNSYPEDPADVAPGHVEQRTHDYVRHGTTTLFAALEIATGEVAGVCKNWNRHQEFLASPTTSWFSIIDREAIHRGSFPSVRDLMIKIRAFINSWNDRCDPSSGPSPPTKSSRKSNVNELANAPLVPD
jgi:hypothetical protein